MTTDAHGLAGQRGPADHERRSQIVSAAREHFRLYGYGKTTVGDLAKALGLSSAYVYKFFDSKRAIGEAVCALCLGEIQQSLRQGVREAGTPAGRLRALFRAVTTESRALLFNERKLHDIVGTAIDERWSVTQAHEAELTAAIRAIIADGRERGAFERKTPLDETCRAVLLALSPLMHPVLLQKHLDTLDEDAAVLAGLVLRSLAP